MNMVIGLKINIILLYNFFYCIIYMDTPTSTPNNTQQLQTHSSINLQCQELKFWQIETKLIIIAGLMFIITSGCIITLILNKGQNCALNNAIFSILGSILGICGTLVSTKNNCRRNSI
jgi:hypothetical protein